MYNLGKLFHGHSRAGPLPPNDLGQGVPGGLAGKRGPLPIDPEGLVVELLHPGLDHHGEVGGGLEPPRVVLCDAGVLPGVAALKLVGRQKTRRLIQLPTW